MTDTIAEKPGAAIATHRAPSGLSDRVAFGFVKALRFVADRFFAKRYGHRAVVLETVAAVPGMVGGLLQHLKALRHIRDDRGWIRELLDEAENERMPPDDLRPDRAAERLRAVRDHDDAGGLL